MPQQPRVKEYLVSPRTRALPLREKGRGKGFARGFEVVKSWQKVRRVLNHWPPLAHFRTFSVHFAVRAPLEKEPRLRNHSFFTHHNGERIERCDSNAKVLYSTNS